MNTIFRFSLFLVALVGAVSIASCGRPPVRVKNAVKATEESDLFRRFLDAVRYDETTRAGDDWTRYRTGLDLLANQFAKPDLAKQLRAMSDQQRKFLESEVHLNDEELAEVESTSFRTADAHYLDECFLLKDAWLRTLDLSDPDKGRQAHHVFRWVMRNVLLHEQTDSWIPPAFVLRRGSGSALERAMVFLALLRQAQIEGCLIVVPDTEPKQFLVAALDTTDKTPSLRLFDTRLGLPLQNKDGAVLSLKEALADPVLLKPSLITPEQVKKLEAWLVCPLYALSPRMRELQRELLGRDAIVLYLNPAELAQDVGKATTRRVKVWNPPAKGAAPPNSPTRCLRLFLAKQEGGVDETGRAAIVSAGRVPLANVLANYEQINFTQELLPRSAFSIMMFLTEDFFNKYELQTREMYLRGLYEPMARRHERLQLFARDDLLAFLTQNKKFREERVAWLNQMADADARADSRDPVVRAKAQNDMQRLWGQDQFVAWLLETAKEEKLDPKHEKTVLTRVLAVGMREHLELELARSQGAVNHEKAVYNQALLQKSSTDAAKKEAREAWIVARAVWANFYLDRIALEHTVKQRIDQMRRIPPDQIGKQIGMLENLHLEVQKYFQARLNLADCKAQVEGTKAADAYLQETLRELESLEKKGLLQARIKALSESIEGSPNARKAIQPRLDLLQRDWSAQGNYFWLKQQIERRLNPHGG